VSIANVATLIPRYRSKTERKNMPNMREHEAQKNFIIWCQYRTGMYPELERVFAIPNGGHRHKSVAGRMKAEGVKRGVPDLCLPVPRGGYHGLYMETKIKPNKPTDHQLDWLAFLAQQGYATAVCYGLDGLVKTVEWYLELE